MSNAQSQRPIRPKNVQPLRLGKLVGASEKTFRLFEDIRSCAHTEYPVLITGESGTGKELVARSIHDLSARRTRNFVSLNCACLSPSLAESELFGHVRGAFTGAERARKGAFNQAHRGTLFLDEFGELALSVQARLLRVLETYDVRAVGADTESKIDVRIICATNANLWKQADMGTFRADLLFRVNVLQLQIPPLRDRLSDLDAIALDLLHRLPSKNSITKEAIQILRQYHWPGNVRELRNVLTRCAIRAGHNAEITAPHASDVLDHVRLRSATANQVEPFRLQNYDAISRCLRANQGHRKRTYESLGIPRSTFYRWLRQGKVIESDAQVIHMAKD